MKLPRGIHMQMLPHTIDQKPNTVLYQVRIEWWYKPILLTLMLRKHGVPGWLWPFAFLELFGVPYPRWIARIVKKRRGEEEHG